MRYYLSVISYIIYAILVVKLLVTSLISSVITGHFVASILKIIVLIFIFGIFLGEWRSNLKEHKSIFLNKKLTKNDLIIFLSVIAGTLLSYILNHNFGLGPVVASGIVGLLGGLLLPNYAVPIYSGSFAGMVSSMLIDNAFSILITGILAGVLFVSGLEVFKGYGGKLGATAYFGTLTASIFFDTISKTMTGDSITLQIEIFVVFMIGALGTYFINQRFHTGAVIASSILGLSSGLLLPVLFSSGDSLAVALFCGTFIGMSSITRLPSKVSIVIASIIGGIIFSYTAPYFGGLGGKLGLIVFGSSIATAGLYDLMRRYSEGVHE